MNIKEQLRQATVSNRAHSQQLQEKALNRAAIRVGLTVKDTTSAAWKTYIN